MKGTTKIASANAATRSQFTATTDTKIVGASQERRTLKIYNTPGSPVLYIGQGAAAVTNADYTLQLNPGSYYTADQSEVSLEHHAMFAAANGTALVTLGS